MEKLKVIYKEPASYFSPEMRKALEEWEKKEKSKENESKKKDKRRKADERHRL